MQDPPVTPPDPASIFSEGAKLIQLHNIAGSLTIPTSRMKKV